MESPQFPKGKIAFLFNMGHDEADRVHVGGDHHFGAWPLLMNDEVTHGIYPACVSVGFRQPLQRRGYLSLISRGPVAVIEHL